MITHSHDARILSLPGTAAEKEWLAEHLEVLSVKERTILSAAMMLRYSFDLEEEAACIENAVSAVLDQGYRTADIMPENPGPDCKKTGCVEMGRLIAQHLRKG